MRDPALQKKAINHGMRKAGPAIEKAGSVLLQQPLTKVRPNHGYRTVRAYLDDPSFGIHSAIGKVPALKKDCTLPGHNYTGPYPLK